jgi:hypothetical protein
VDNPIDTLVQRYRTFRGQGGEILATGRDIAGTIYRLKQQSPSPAAAITELEQLLEQNKQLYLEWAAANEKVQSAIGTLKTFHVPLPEGLGVPVVLPAIAITAIAAAVTAMIVVGGKLLAQKQMLRAVKDKLLTPQEAAAISQAAGAGIGFGDIGKSLGSVVQLAIFGAVLYFLWPMLTRSRA